MYLNRALHRLPLLLSATLVGCTWDSGDDNIDVFEADDDGGTPVESTPDDSTPTDATPAECLEDAVARRYEVYHEDGNGYADPVRVRQLITSGYPVNDLMNLGHFTNYYHADGLEPAAAGTLALVPALRKADGTEYNYDLVIAAVAPTASTPLPIALTFLVDTSLSMDGLAIELVREVLVQTAAGLEPGDLVSVVSLNGAVLLEPRVVEGANDLELLEVADSLVAAGDEDLSAGLEQAYALADASFSPERANRVLLVTDGGMAAGSVDEARVLDHVTDRYDTSIYLGGIGVSSQPELYDNTLLDDLTRLGRGPHLFLDSVAETQASLAPEVFRSRLQATALDLWLEVTLPPGMSSVTTSWDSHDQSSVREKQPLSPDAALLFAMTLSDCAGSSRSMLDTLTVTAHWTDPATGEAREAVTTVPLGLIVDAQPRMVDKYLAMKSYARGLTEVWLQKSSQRRSFLDEVYEELQSLFASTSDPDIGEAMDLVDMYRRGF